MTLQEAIEQFYLADSDDQQDRKDTLAQHHQRRNQ